MPKQAFVTAVPTPYLSEPAAAAYMNRPRRSLQQMRWKGDGPRFLKLGRNILYRKTDLDEWLAQRAVLKTRNSDDGIPLSQVMVTLSNHQNSS